jgi:DNA primase
LAVYIPDEKIVAIKNASDIVDIVSEVVSLRRAGRNFLGLCPFHAEKTPSFTVSPDKQIFYCFGCGAGGNVFSFLMKNGGLTFPEAARALAGRYGIDLPTRKMSSYEKKKLTERETILTLNAEAMSFYHDCLLSGDRGKQAVGYLLKRGMTKKTIDEFKLGFAPDGWDHLVRHFRSQRKPVETALQAGLIVPRKKGEGYYDRFRNRIIFPIFNRQNQPVGFGGRVMDDALPKYLNSPETPVYNKSRSLYGLNKARQKCREARTVYVVEGYFDQLSMHQFGIENTLATLGTSLTADHVQILKGFVGEGGKAVLVYDSDQAGIKAAQRSVAVFQKGLLEARIMVLPRGHDPDSFIMAHGPADFFKESEKAMGVIAIHDGIRH